MIDQNARAIFVKNLHRFMEERRITQADIAQRMKLTPSTVSDWYNGKNYPRVDAMQRLAELLDVSMRDLIAENGLGDVLSFDERHIIDLYRKLNQDGKEYIFKTLLMATGNEAFTAENAPVPDLGNQGIK